MKSLIVGGDSTLGKVLARMLPDAIITTRGEVRSLIPNPAVAYDMVKDSPAKLPDADVVYLVAAITKFRECELNFDSYTVNVDAPIAIAAEFRKRGAHIVYISSEAATWPGPTAYGMQKRTCEQGMLAVCGHGGVSIIRPGQFKERTDEFAKMVIEIGSNKKTGVHLWK